MGLLLVGLGEGLPVRSDSQSGMWRMWNRNETKHTYFSILLEAQEDCLVNISDSNRLCQGEDGGKADALGMSLQGQW